MLKREIDAVAKVLASPENQDKTAEQVAEEVVSAIDELRAKHNRLAVVARYTWDEETYHLSVIGPFSTRASGQAQQAGEGMVGSLAHPGKGKWMLATVYPSPRAAWDATKPTDLAQRREAARIARMMRDDFDPWAREGPQCCCGVRPDAWCYQHGRRNPPAHVLWSGKGDQ